LHFHEWNGIGLFTTTAKSQGEFSHQLLVTTIHCPVSFFRHGNQQHVGKLRTLMADWMEKFQTEHSSVVLAPSRFILNWVHTVHNWTLPIETFVQPNIASADAVMSGQQNSKMPDAKLEINELIYFGRIEVLKGVDDFVDALDWLLSHHAQVLNERLFPLKVTFLGQANIKNIINQIKDHAIARHWPFELSFHSSLSHSESLQYFKRKLETGRGSGPLAVLLSRIDNSPNTVLELTSLGVPFVAMNVGGVSELIDHSEYARVLINSISFAALMQSHFSLPKFADDVSFHSGSDVSRIADKIALALQGGFRPVKSAAIAQNARKRLSMFHQTHLPRLLRQQLSSRIPIEPLNHLVSVVICHHNRGSYLVESIRSIFQQTHAQLELILVDDGSTEPDAILYLAALASFFVERLGNRFHIFDESNTASNYTTWDEPEIQAEQMEYVVSRLAKLPLNFHRIVLVLNKNQRPGGSRNVGVKYSHGEFVAFLDDDDLVRSNWIAALLNVAQHRSADVVTTMADFFYDIDWQPWLPYADRNHFQNTSSIPIFARWLPIGSAAAAGMFENMYGAYASLWNRQAFKRIGGFSEDFASTFEDWELFSTAVLSGLKLELCVEPVYLYRQYSDHHRFQNQTRASAIHLMGSGQTNAYLNELRALRPYLNAVPRELRDVLSFSIGLYHHHTGSQ
jgi:glycosyltransferase involved in cell wall biosynthesis